MKEIEHTLVISGRKNPITVLVLNTKKISSVQKIFQDAVHENKGLLASEDSAIFPGFRWSNTVKAALEIKKQLDEKNIEAGIGIESGYAVIVEEKPFKYTDLSFATREARKIASKAENEILLGKEAYEKAKYEIKAKKKNDEYVLIGLSLREKHKSRVEQILRRIKESERKA